MENYKLICSASRSLLGKVTPNLRAVYINSENEEVVLSFYYDKQPSENEIELANLADTEFLGDFPDNLKSDFKILTIPFQRTIPNKGLCVYQRYENLM